MVACHRRYSVLYLSWSRAGPHYVHWLRFSLHKVLFVYSSMMHVRCHQTGAPGSTYVSVQTAQWMTRNMVPNRPCLICLLAVHT